MKLYYTFILVLFLTTSCNNTESGEVDSEKKASEKTSRSDKDVTPSEMLSKRWVLVKRTTINEDKVIEFNETNSSVITFFEGNGYFRVYDSLTDHDKTQGVKKIEQRQSGQWEILDNKLILRYTHPDTVIIEEHEIEKLEKSELVLKSVDKNQINKYIVKPE
jgi:hypothetical protein